MLNSSDVKNIPKQAPIKTYEVSSSFGYRTHPITGKVRSIHTGVDLKSPKGTPVYATADGIVNVAKRRGGYGKLVEIHHGNKIVTRYAHLSKIKSNRFDRIKKGDIIGYVGSTGRSTGDHLHYEIRFDDVPLNPEEFITE